MTRWVLLRHDLPNGSHHFDWLIELPIWGEHRLLAWRLETPAPIEPDAPSFRAEPIPLHRAHYLTFEGPLSGGRGRVTRIAAGPGRLLARTPDACRIEIEHAGAHIRFAGAPARAASLFEFTRQPPA
ncbi:MAG: hypothetical protein RIB60_09455 [Phycisphaerales bacterium]